MKGNSIFFNKLACTSDIKPLKIHCGIPAFYYFHVLFSPCFFFFCLFLNCVPPPTGAIPSEEPSSHISPEAAGLSGPCSHQEGEQRLSSPVAPSFHCCVFSVPSEPASLVSDFPPAVGIFHAGLLEEACLGTVTGSRFYLTCRLEQNHCDAHTH